MAGVLAALLALPPAVVKAQPGLLHEEESRYQFIQVVQDGGARYLYLNEGYAIHSVWRPDTVLTGGEWDMFLTAPPLLGRPAARVAILGNAAGTTARAYGVYYPQARIDGVELDPAVTAAGRRWFGLGDNPRLTVHTADARPYLASSGARYDLILIDAYRQPYVPFYLATREFFRLCRQRLAPGGIVCLNVSTVPGDHRLAEGIAGTLRTRVPAGPHLAGAALQPVRRGPHGAALAGADQRPPGRGAARPRARHAALRPRLPRGLRGSGPMDRRPLPRRVGHRPHDRRLRGPRAGDVRGPPADRPHEPLSAVARRRRRSPRGLPFEAPAPRCRV